MSAVHPDDVGRGTPCTITDLVTLAERPARIVDVHRESDGRITQAIVEDDVTGDRLFFFVHPWWVGGGDTLRTQEGDHLYIGAYPEVREGECSTA